MLNQFSEAKPHVVGLVQEIIGLYHEGLQDAKIGILMRDEAPESNGMMTLGQARKVSPEHRALMPYDFIIWFAQDEWDKLNTKQRRALVDHELCHCSLHRGKTSIRRHDIEEFNCIIERYGFWRPYTGKWTEVSVQRNLLFAGGKVEAIKPSAQTHDVLEQVGEMLDEEQVEA